LDFVSQKQPFAEGVIWQKKLLSKRKTIKKQLEIKGVEKYATIQL